MATSFVPHSPYLAKDRVVNLVLSDLITCPLCQGILWLPVACKPCDTPFCLSCIKTWNIEAPEPTRCPNHCPEYEQRKCPAAVSYILSTLRVICCNKTNGCPEIVLYNSLETHEESCDYQLKTCSGCGERIIKRNFSQHHQRCPSVLLTCPECNSVYQRQNQDQHTETNCLRVQLYQVRDQIVENEQWQRDKMHQMESEMNDLVETISRLIQRKTNPETDDDIYKKMNTLSLSSSGCL